MQDIDQYLGGSLTRKGRVSYKKEKPGKGIIRVTY